VYREILLDEVSSRTCKAKKNVFSRNFDKFSKFFQKEFLLNFAFRETRQCLANKFNMTGKPFKIILAGDSRMRQLWYGIQEQITAMDGDFITNHTLDSKRLARPNPTGRLSTSTQVKKHENQIVNLETINVQLRLEFYFIINFDEKKLKNLLENTSTDGVPADILIVSGGVWSMLACKKANKNDTECIKQYTRSGNN
jgi:hypothetical protein